MMSLSPTPPRVLNSLDALSKNFANGYVKTGQSVIDINCGNGLFTIELAKMVGTAGKVYAIDKDAACLRAAKENAEKEGITNITFLKADVTEKSFFNEHYSLVEGFDVAHCRSLLRLQKDPGDVIRRVLSFVKTKTEEKLRSEGKLPSTHFLERDGVLLIEEFGETNYSLCGASPFSKIALSCSSLAKRFFSLFKPKGLEETLRSFEDKELLVSTVSLQTQEEKTYFAATMQSKTLRQLTENPKVTLMHNKFIQIAL